jgi:hypothetical protein
MFLLKSSSLSPARRRAPAQFVTRRHHAFRKELKQKIHFCTGHAGYNAIFSPSVLSKTSPLCPLCLEAAEFPLSNCSSLKMEAVCSYRTIVSTYKSTDVTSQKDIISNFNAGCPQISGNTFVSPTVTNRNLPPLKDTKDSVPCSQESVSNLESDESSSHPHFFIKIHF